MSPFKYNINCAGLKATVSLTAAASGSAFSGMLESEEYGEGFIAGSYSLLDEGTLYRGNVDLDGHYANFVATAVGNKVTGHISYGWFFHETFAGELVT